jgi:hypothetical protein
VTFGSWSTAIAAADLPAVHAHLDLAVRHLEDARELIASLTEHADLTALKRSSLNDDAAEAGLLIDQLTRTIAGSSLDEELARFLHAMD